MPDTRRMVAVANEANAAAIHKYELELKERIRREAINRLAAEEKDIIRCEQWKKYKEEQKLAEESKEDDEYGPSDQPPAFCSILGGTKRKRKPKITRKHKKRSYKHKRSRSYKRKH